MPPRFLRRGSGIDRPGCGGRDDPSTANELTQLTAGELTRPSKEHESLEHRLNVMEGFAGEDLTQRRVVALVVMDDRVERGMGATARLEEVVERGERRRLRVRLVRRTVCHGRSIPSHVRADMGQIGYQAPGPR
jgi:hypothetical protein